MLFQGEAQSKKAPAKKTSRGKENARVRGDRESPAEDRDQAQTAEGAVGASAMNFDI